MSYSVQYGVSRYDKKPVPKRKRWFLIAGSILSAVVMMNIMFPEQVEVVRDRLLPFFEPGVQEAFGEMVSEIGKGTSVSEAAAAFCREIISEASY